MHRVRMPRHYRKSLVVIPMGSQQRQDGIVRIRQNDVALQPLPRPLPLRQISNCHAM